MENTDAGNAEDPVTAYHRIDSEGIRAADACRARIRALEAELAATNRAYSAINRTTVAAWERARDHLATLTGEQRSAALARYREAPADAQRCCEWSKLELRDIFAPSKRLRSCPLHGLRVYTDGTGPLGAERDL
jgi:hypothetical protein